MKNLIAAIIIILTLSGCSNTCEFTSKRDVSINEKFSGKNIAVLNFKTRNIKSVYGEIIADKLSNAFYLISKYSLIDRSFVKNAQKEFLVQANDNMSFEEIQKLGLSLKAEYLLIGDISRDKNVILFDEDEEDKNNCKAVKVSFRILSVRNGDVAGIGNFSERETNSLDGTIETIADSIAKYMTIKQ